MMSLIQKLLLILKGSAEVLKARDEMERVDEESEARRWNALSAKMITTKKMQTSAENVEQN